MRLSVPFAVTSPLPADLGHVPISARIDFAALIRAAGGAAGDRLDCDSIEVVDLADGATVPHHLDEEFAHGDAGRVEFAIRDPAHAHYQIRLATLPAGAKRGPPAPRVRTPAVGVGDLLRCNAGQPRPLTLFSFQLVDLDGDGAAQLAGTWNYYHRPGEPRSGVVCYPRVPHPDSPLHFGDQVRLRFRAAGGELQPFAGTYVCAAFGDLSGDGRPDLAFAEWNTGRVELYRNTGEGDGGGWPVFAHGSTLSVPSERIQSLCLADLDGDGRLDLVFNGRWMRNANRRLWPFEPGDMTNLGAGPGPLGFVDVDGDGRLDLVGLEERAAPDAATPGAADHPDADGAWPGSLPFWCERRPGRTPAFGPRRPLLGLPPSATGIAAASDPALGGRGGLLVQHDVWQEISLFALSASADGSARAERVARAESVSAVLCLSDQAWPCFCDWDGDGATDLLVGGGYGWPRIVRNAGTDAQPAYAPPQLILSEGRPIRLLRDEILHSAHWHNMGYPYPAFVDWDGDGLPDLMLPNETNRIFWYRNLGPRAEPRFGPRLQLLVDGYPDDEETRADVGRRAQDRDAANHPYPADATSPFWWRTGAAFADLDGDGRCDLITHDEERKLTLFTQYIAADGSRRLRKARRLHLVDGRQIDDAVVGRDQHWTESFRAVDWDGDGRLDLIYNTAGTGHIYLLRNAGSATDPVFEAPRLLHCYGEPIAFTIHGPNAWPVDYNGDGRPDLVGCVEWSVYPFFAHAALEMDAHPDWKLGPPTCWRDPGRDDR